MTTPDPRYIEAVAKTFHETYERLAPEYSYKTRQRSAVPWAEVPEDNKKLMLATVEVVLAAVRALDAQALAAIPQERRGRISKPWPVGYLNSVEIAAVYEALGIEAGDE